MLTSLITLPIRAGLRGAELGLRVSQALVERAINLVGEVLSPTASPQPSRSAREPQPAPRGREARKPRETPKGDPRSAAAPPPPPPPPPAAEPPPAAPAAPEASPPAPDAAPPAPEASPAPPPPAPAPPTPAAPPVPAPSAPAHIETDDTVVEEVAEPGAEEGAGAQIHVSEPWEGYSQLKAADILDRLAGRDAAELATVELYELSHRRRRTVIDAAKRELRRVQSPPGS